MKKFILPIILAFVICSAAGSAYAATEFVSTIKAADGDYSSLASWVAAQQCDLTSTQTKVFSSTKTGTVSDGATVTVTDKAATVVHATAAQVLFKDIRTQLIGTVTFTNGSATVTGSGTVFASELSPNDYLWLEADKVWARVSSIASDTSLTLTAVYSGTGGTGVAYKKSGSLSNGNRLSVDGSNYLDLTNAGDSVIAAAECYPIAAGDGAVTISGFTTNAVNYVHIYAPAAYTHTGKWMAYTSCYTIYTTSVHWAMSANVSNILIEGIQIYSNENYNGGGCVSIALPAPAGEQIYNRVIFRGKNSSNRCDGFGQTATGQGTLIRLQNCVFFNLGNNNNTAAVWHSDTLDFYCFNVSVYYSTTGFCDFDTADKVVNCIVAKCSNSNGYSGYAGTFSADSDYNIVTEQGLAYASDTDTIVPGANSQALTGVLGTDIFVDPANGDCHLKSADTYARGHGTNLSSVTSRDIDNERPNTWNVGADQTTTEAIRTIRAGQTISTIARVSGVTTVTLSAAYPNSNLKAGQTIVISGVPLRSFNGVFAIASVTSQTVFTISQPYLPDASSTGATAGGDYATLTAWEAAFGGVNFYLTAATAGDLVTAQRIAVAECYDDWANGLDDLCFIDGWTTSASYYSKVYTPASERHDGTVAGRGFYIKSTSGAADVYPIYLCDPYIIIDGIKAYKTSTNWASGAVISISNVVPSNGCTVKNCLLIQESGGGSASILYSGADAANGYGPKIYNNILASNSSTCNYGLAISHGYSNDAAHQGLIYNNTIYGTFDGAAVYIDATNTTGDTYKPLIKNNYACNTGTGADYTFANLYNNTLSVFDYNASDDGTAGTSNHNQTITAALAKFYNTTYATADLHIQNGSSLIGAGTDLSSTFTTDIDNGTRLTGLWDIGADQAPTQIYRSVGPSATTALATGSASCTLSIDAATGAATFSSDLPLNVGVGDVIQYDDNGTTTPDQLAFISGRTSSTVFSVRQAAGTLPAATSANINWNIYRAYTSLTNAESGTENTSVNAALRNFDTFSGGKDLVSANQQWNIACYNGEGGVADTIATSSSGVEINGWTTGVKNYMRIFTPITTSEVGVSQRHNGRWNTNAYRLELTPTGNAGSGINSSGNCLRIEGLQLGIVSNGYTSHYALKLNGTDVRVSNCIIKNDTVTGQGIAGEGGTLRFWDNIVYGFTYGIASYYEGVNSYFYNNTVYGCTNGIKAHSSTCTAKNNISYNNTDNYVDSFAGTSTNNLSGPSQTDAPGLVPKNAAAVTFVSTTAGSEDFHLSSSYSGVALEGADLSSDTYLSFSDDIDTGLRWAPWSIGADQSAVSVASAVTTGNWNTAATWASGAVPTQTQDVIIASGKTITFDKNDSAVSPTCGTLTISGTLVIDTTTAANRTMVVNGDIIVKSGGVLRLRSNSSTSYSTTIKFNCASNVQYGLLVESGGTLDIQGTSKYDPDVIITSLTQDNLHNAYILGTSAKIKVKFADISYMGANVVYKYGLSVYSIDSSSASEYFYIEGCKVHHGYYGIYTIASAYNTFTSNNIYLNATYGSYFDCSINNTFTSNNSYSNGNSGIYLTNVSNSNIITSNNSYSNGGDNGMLVIGCSNNIIYNNTSIRNNASGIKLWITSLNNILRNNLIAYNASYGINDDDNTSEPTNSYNDLYANTSGTSNQITEGTGTVNVAPNFFAYPNGDSTFTYSSGGASAATQVVLSTSGWTANKYAGYVLWASKGETAATNIFRRIEYNTATASGTSTIGIYGTWPSAMDGTYTYKVIDWSVQAAELLGGGCNINTGDASSAVNIGSKLGYIKNTTDSTEFGLLQAANDAATCTAGDTVTVYAVDQTKRIE